MKDKMSIPVRLKLFDLLSNGEIEGDSGRFLLIDEMKRKLSLSEEEIKLVGYEVMALPEGGYFTTMNHQDKDPMKEIEVGEIITDIVCKMLRPLEETGKLKQRHYDIFLWFKPAIDEMRKKEAELKKQRK